jgi:hypothetical protein
MTYHRKPPHYPPAFPTLNNNKPITSFGQLPNNLDLVDKFGQPDNNGGFQFQNDETGKMVRVQPSCNGLAVEGDLEEVEQFKQTELAPMGFIDWFISWWR